MEPIQSSGYDPYADIRGNNKGQFSSDLAFGLVGEGHAESIVRALMEGWVEVKTDGFENGNLFIEVAHCPGRVRKDDGDFQWTKSGLNVTQAKYYMYLKQAKNGELRSAVIIPTERLRRFHAWVKAEKGSQIQAPGFKGTGYMYGNIDGQVPTIGLRICAQDVEMLRNTSDFD
jgi:hypothetical protein